MSDLDKITSEDTDNIQKAIEQVVDQDSETIPIADILDAEEKNADAMNANADAASGTEAEVAAETESDTDVEDFAQDEDSLVSSYRDTSVHSWFFTFMCMNIPIVGWIYLLYLGFNKKQTDRRSFARAYLFYRLLFLLISAVILGVIVYLGLQVLDQILAYMEML